MTALATPGDRIRVLVVEDSITVRVRLTDVLAGDPEIEVVGEAADGQQAIEHCLALRPDVITMDMMLPVIDGLGATEHIMAHCPTPILIVSSSINRGDLFNTYEALAAGAVDVLEKPHGDEPDGVWEAKLLQMVKLVARIKVITHLRARLRQPGGVAAPMPRTRTPRTRMPTPPPVPRTLTPPAPRTRTPPTAASGLDAKALAAVAIGASTGGPGAIVELLRSLPDPFPLPILVVMHIGDPFGAVFAEWLDGRTGRRVAFARDGEPLGAAAGRVAMAPPNHHLVVRDGRLRLTAEPERHSCRPSVDVLFESVARELGPAAAACLLTGMGRDGASGLLAIRLAGGLTFAQDEATSVVYGMPREAVALGAAARVLPIQEIGPALAGVVGDRGGGTA